MSRRNQVQMNLYIGSTYVARKLSGYLQLNHIACAGQFGEVTSIFLCIILCSRYCVPYHCPEFFFICDTSAIFTNFFRDSQNVPFLVYGGILVMLVPDHQVPLCFSFQFKTFKLFNPDFLRNMFPDLC